MKHQLKLISKLSQVNELIQYCKDTGYACIDFETNARKPMDPEFKATIISVSFQPGSAWVIPLAHKDSPFKKTWRKVYKLFAEEVLQDRRIIKIAWNAKYEYKVSLALGYRILGRLFDPMLLKYLLDENPPNDLKSQVDFLLPEFGGYDLPNQPGRKASEEAQIRFWEGVPLKELSKYGAIDADMTFRLFLHYDTKVMGIGLYHYSRNFYGPLTHIVSETEYKGVIVDDVYLEAQVQSFQKSLDDLERGVREIPFIRDYEENLIESKVESYIEELQNEIDDGNLSQAQINNRLTKISRLELGEATTKKEAKLLEPLNFNSTTQMAELLYGDKGFQFDVQEFTESGNPSCGESALKALRGEDDTGFIQALLTHREMSKMFTTYLKGIYENHLTDWGTIHPGYLFQGTTTGRFSSRNPSFQTMPRSTTSSEIKKQFIAPDDFYFVEIDGCIPGYVKISTQRGLIPMEEVGPQDQVLLGGKFYQVVNQWSTGIKEVFEITTNTGRKIQATTNHPFLTPSGWVELGELESGDFLTLDTSLSNPTQLKPNYLESYVPERPFIRWSEIISGRYEVIESIEYLGKDRVYDLEVQGSHAFVANGVIVHNSQMELRFVAELSGDENMLSVFRNNQNIHAMTAALLTGKPYELINKLRKDENHPDHTWAIKEHKKAKVLNFTILYGAGPPTVSEFVTDATGVYHSKADAQEMIDQWFEAYPGVAVWIKKQHKFSIKNGYLANPFGRRRRFPILENPNNRKQKPGLWNEALRQGPNAKIQGGSSDVTQWVNISIQRERLAGNLPAYLWLVSTVHDSLEFYIHKNDMGTILPRIIDLAKSLKDMKKYMGWTMNRVEMKFSAEFGINWGKMHEFDPDKKHKDFDFVAFYDAQVVEYCKEPFPHLLKLK